MSHSHEEELPIIQLQAIGRIRTPFQQASGTPIQSAFSNEEKAVVEIFPAYREGLKDLQDFERIWLLYYLDRASEPEMLVQPYLDNDSRHGVFATRSPARPNPIGMAAVSLLDVQSDKLLIAGVDMLDNTPLLDIKPYLPAIDSFEVKRVGWYKDRLKPGINADSRFERALTEDKS
jgi:tRNA (adenine37-N6)-methyltransferase